MAAQLNTKLYMHKPFKHISISYNKTNIIKKKILLIISSQDSA